MSNEFEKLVIEKLDNVQVQIGELRADVNELKEEMKEVKADVSELKEDIEILKNEVFNVIKPSLKSIEDKVDVMINVNTARILENQTKNHKQIMEKIERYEIKNELEHKRLDYEICKLKARA